MFSMSTARFEISDIGFSYICLLNIICRILGAYRIIHIGFFHYSYSTLSIQENEWYRCFGITQNMITSLLMRQFRNEMIKAHKILTLPSKGKICMCIYRTLCINLIKCWRYKYLILFPLYPFEKETLPNVYVDT
jgi:hypothetical protein